MLQESARLFQQSVLLKGISLEDLCLQFFKMQPAHLTFKEREVQQAVLEDDETVTRGCLARQEATVEARLMGSQNFHARKHQFRECSSHFSSLSHRWFWSGMSFGNLILIWKSLLRFPQGEGPRKFEIQISQARYTIREITKLWRTFPTDQRNPLRSSALKCSLSWSSKPKTLYVTTCCSF